MNVPFANMEMSQELLLKSRLINEFSMQGVTFTQEMLTIISNYWQESKKVYSEKCKVLENDLSKLRHKCDAQEAKIKELECLLSESQEKIKENDENQCLHSNMDEVFKIIRYLNTKFLADVEINLRDSQKTLCKPSWKIPEEKPVVEEKIPEDLGSLASKLYELIQISSNDDLKLYHAQLTTLWELLYVKIDVDMTTSYMFSDKMLEQSSDMNELIQDVNMGVQLNVPQMQVVPTIENNSVNRVAEPAPKSKGVFRVHRLPQYMKSCGEEINGAGDRLIHREVVLNNLPEVKRHCIALKLMFMGVDVVNEDYQTPLHFAVIHSASIDVICTLLKYNADICKADSDGNTVMHFAVESESLSRLLQPSVRELVDDVTYRRLVNKTNNEGYSPLHLAAMHGKKKQVEELIALEANVDCCDSKSGRTALYHAIENNYVDIVNILNNHNADPHIRNYSGTSIIDALADAESDFSPEMKRIFYDARQKVIAARDPDDPFETASSSSSRKRIKRTRKMKLDNIGKKLKS